MSFLVATTSLPHANAKIGATVQKLQALLYWKYFRLKNHKFYTMESNSRHYNPSLDSRIKF